MKTLQIVRMIVLFFITFLFFLSPAYATGNEISVKNKLHMQEEESIRMPLTDSAIKLTGPDQEKTFYYEINSKPTSANNQLVLSVKNSELLISPSSITVHVDETPVLSKRLTGDETKQEIIVPLEGEALEKGFHRVKVAFHGILKEGVCVAQESSANWLSIGVESYFKLSGQAMAQERTLKDYPSRFLGTAKRPTIVVLPNQPSDETIDSGMKIAAYLAERSNEEKSVQIIRESNRKQIEGEVLFVGSQDEFDSPFVKDVMKKADLQIEKDALTLSRSVFVEGKQTAEILFVTGESAEAIGERISVLLNDRFTQQLSGEQMVIRTTLERNENENLYEIPLKEMGIPNITLDSTETESDQFFYYAPQAIQQNNDIVLQLNLKRSETIAERGRETEREETYFGRDVELTVYVNDIPHSVDMRALKESENHMYNVQIPITAKELNDSHLMSIQFKASGLRKEDPCHSTDENHWIYIADDSFLALPQRVEMKTPTLAKFPSPFIDKNEETIVILPEEIDDQQLLDFYRAMQFVGIVPEWQLVRAESVVATDLTNAHLVFLSGLDTQPLLQKEQEKLLVSYKNEIPLLSSFGFVQEAVEQVSWIQSSPWNEERAMLVFDRLNQETPSLSTELLKFLRQTNEMATMAVQTNGKEIYTNASQFEKGKSKGDFEQSLEESSTFSIWSIIGFVGLILTVVLLLMVVLRKQRRVKS